MVTPFTFLRSYSICFWCYSCLASLTQVTTQIMWLMLRFSYLILALERCSLVENCILQFTWLSTHISNGFSTLMDIRCSLGYDCRVKVIWLNWNLNLLGVLHLACIQIFCAHRLEEQSTSLILYFLYQNLSLFLWILCKPKVSLRLRDMCWSTTIHWCFSACFTNNISWVESVSQVKRSTDWL